MSTRSSQKAKSVPVMAIWAATTITIIDGFDAFSMSLTAPRIISELAIPTSWLGEVFASTIGGMITGAVAGGALADKLGRLRVLLIALFVFGSAALTMCFVTNSGQLLLNRLVAGIGLGAAAPIAVALLNHSDSDAPSDLIVSFVWAGLALGGVFAAGFNYFVIPSFGWRSIFVAGGVLPFAAAIGAYAIFQRRAHAERNVNDADKTRKSRIADLFRGNRARQTIATALMFFFGYITTSMIVNWLPTILNHSNASALMISATFAGVNVGSALGALGLGYVSSHTHSAYVLTIAWISTGICVGCAALPGTEPMLLAFLGIAAATAGVGSQSLSVAYANRLHHSSNLESTSIGFMIGAGRVGQFTALSASGALLAIGLPEKSVLAVAGVSACIAGIVALLIAKQEVLLSP